MAALRRAGSPSPKTSGRLRVSSVAMRFTSVPADGGTLLLLACSLMRCLSRSSGHGRTRTQFTIVATVVDAERAGPEGRDLKQPARDHHVFEEVDHLVLVGEV